MHTQTVLKAFDTCRRRQASIVAERQKGMLGVKVNDDPQARKWQRLDRIATKCHSRLIARARIADNSSQLLGALDLIRRIANLESGELSQKEWDEYIAPFAGGGRSSEASMMAILDAIQAIARTASQTAQRDE